MTEYAWTDNPMVTGVSDCDTDTVNDCLMHLKYTKTKRNVGSTESSLVPLSDADLHIYDGSLLSGSGTYADFVDFMASKYANDPKNRLAATGGTLNANLGINSWKDIAYNGSKFVAIGADGYISTSTDGVTWSTATLVTNLNGVVSTGWYNIAYGDGKFVALNSNGYVSTSTDGVTWSTATSTTLGSHSWQSITYGNNIFLAMGSSGNVGTSTNGTTWTATTALNALYVGDAVVYDGSKFVSIGVLSRVTYVSTSTNNGASWTEPVQLTSDLFNTLAFDGTNFISVSATKVMSSSDGTTWTEVRKLENLANNTTDALTYGNGKFVVLTLSGHSSVITWERDTFCTEAEWQSSINNYGQCGKFVYNSENNTLRLPKVLPVINDEYSSPIHKYAVVGTSVVQDVEVNLDNVATDLNNKVDVDFRNISNKSGFRKLVKAEKNETAWYKIYREYDTLTGDYIGLWAECGDLYYKGSTMASSDSTISFPFVADDYKFVDTKYTFIPQLIHSEANLTAGYGLYEKYTERTVSSAKIRIIGAYFGYSYYACGYVKSTVV